MLGALPRDSRTVAPQTLKLEPAQTAYPRDNTQQEQCRGPMISQRVPIAATLAITSYLLAASTICLAAEKTITDASGRAVKFSDTSRILSIGGDITEILYALK